VKNYHERASHAAGVNFILCQLSERFWIIATHEEIPEWDHECNKCKKRWKKQGCILLSGPSPKQRWILQVLSIPFKDVESLDRKGG